MMVLNDFMEELSEVVCFVNKYIKEVESCYGEIEGKKNQEGCD